MSQCQHCQFWVEDTCLHRDWMTLQPTKERNCPEFVPAEVEFPLSEDFEGGV